MKNLLVAIPVAGLSWLVAGAAKAQSTTRPGQARLADCVRELGGDSVALYYNKFYELTPVGCATLRRVAHFDAQTSFHGEARDYELATNRLLYRQHYSHGKRQGRYEAYYPNGQVQLRGTYEQGEPSGEWQLWYASGQPRQVVRWDASASQPWRFVACWDSTGQQLLTGGNGRWQEINPRLGRRVEGTVVNELPEGEWQLYHLNQQKLLATETFVHGAFQKGHSWVGLGPANYRDKSRLSLQFEDRSASAEQFRLGDSCEELAKNGKGFTVSGGTFTLTRPVGPGLKTSTQPHPNGDVGNYLRQVLQHLAGLPSMRALLRDPQYAATVTAEIDEGGLLGSFRSADSDVQRVFAQLLPALGRWHAATLGGQPARSQVQFRLSVLDQHWEVNYHTSLAGSGPARRP